MKVRDSKKRTIFDVIGNRLVFSLRRFQCSKCGKIHTEIPDCIIPHKQYSKNAIESVVSEKCDYYMMDASTLYRWRKEKHTQDAMTSMENYDKVDSRR